jgi:hypothetical protein
VASISSAASPLCAVPVAQRCLRPAVLTCWPRLPLNHTTCRTANHGLHAGIRRLEVSALQSHTEALSSAFAAGAQHVKPKFSCIGLCKQLHCNTDGKVSNIAVLTCWLGPLLNQPTCRTQLCTSAMHRGYAKSDGWDALNVHMDLGALRCCSCEMQRANTQCCVQGRSKAMSGRHCCGSHNCWLHAA